jgi:hypothetical protein
MTSATGITAAPHDRASSTAVQFLGCKAPSTASVRAPEIQELDVNPVIVRTSSAWAADVRVRIDRSRPAKAGRRVVY